MGLKKVLIRLLCILFFFSLVMGGQAHAEVNLAALKALDGSAKVELLNGQFNRRNGQITYNAVLTNQSTVTLQAPFYVLFTDITPDTVTLVNSDDTSTEGMPLFILGEGALAPGATLTFQVILQNSVRARYVYTTHVYTATGGNVEGNIPPELIGTWIGPCKTLGGEEFTQEVLIIKENSLLREHHNAYSEGCKSRWLTVSNAYKIILANVVNLGTSGAELDLTLIHTYVAPYESEVSKSLNRICSKHDFVTNMLNIADSVKCQGNVNYPSAGTVHYDRLKYENAVIHLGDRLDVTDVGQRPSQFNALAFEKAAP